MSFQACVEISRYAATDDVDALVAALDSASPDTLASLRAHQLRPLIRRTLETHGAEVAPPVRAALHDPTPRPDAATLLRAYVEVREALAARTIPSLLMKGPVLGQRLYGDINRRPQFDIDILVHRRHARRARRVLQAAGYRRRGRDDHSVTLARDGVSIDLHHALRTAPAYRIDEAAIWERAVDMDVGGHHVRTLADEDTLTLLALGLLEDIAFGMAKLKNVCDIWLLLRAMPVPPPASELVMEGCAIANKVMNGEAHDLMTAARGSPANLAWFGTIYPGSLLRFRLHTFVGGLPATLRYLHPGRLGFHVALVTSRRRTRRPTSDRTARRSRA